MDVDDRDTHPGQIDVDLAADALHLTPTSGEPDAGGRWTWLD